MATQAERIAALETRQTTIEEDVRETRVKVDAIHAFMLEAKGARWAFGKSAHLLSVLVSGAVGAAAALATKYLPLALPK